MKKRLAINQFAERSADGLDEFIAYMKSRKRTRRRCGKAERQREDADDRDDAEEQAAQLGVGVMDLEAWGEWRPFNVSTTRCPESARVMSFDDSTLSSLSPEQRQAVFLIEAGLSVFVTGPGGTGKSRIISMLREAAAAQGLSVSVTASTGIAARNIGGVTLHRFAGVGLRPENFAGAGGSRLDRVPATDKRIACWRNCDLLVVDEISMVDPGFMAQLDLIARASRRKAPAIKPSTTERPFGGIQLVLLGDFAQLTIAENGPSPSTSPTAAKLPLCLLKYVPFVVELRTIFRQSDPRFRQLLNNIRLGKKVRGDLFILSTRKVMEGGPAAATSATSAPQLSAFRKIVHELNHKQMRELCQVGSAAPHTFKLEVVTESGEVAERVDPADIGWEGEVMTLCVGARVLLTKNLDQEKGLVNGSMGRIVDFGEDDGLPRVKWDDASLSVTTVPIVTQEFEHTRCKLTVNYLPLLCAWAITVHRAQGMTLTRARIHARSMKTPALLYTALSRVASLEGLEVVGDVEEENIVANEQAVSFYNRLQELVDTQAEETHGLCVLPSHVLV
jgi:ATP-dependent DNA helicase PIF1